MESLIGINEVSDMLGVTRDYVYKLVQKNEITYYKVGRYLKFKPSEVEEWIEAKRK